MKNRRQQRCSRVHYVIGGMLSAMVLSQFVMVELYAPSLNAASIGADRNVRLDRVDNADISQTSHRGENGNDERKTATIDNGQMAALDHDGVDDHVVATKILTPLSDFDREFYSVRINTWKRNPQLIAAVDHIATCDGVARVQVVWCDADEQPPPDILHHPSDKVVVEYHTINNLNERFRILDPSPTLGILSIDDDILRPCEALDAGFFKWTTAPDRMIAFDSRLHVENPGGNWQYGYLSTTRAANKYSMGLTRCCFLHRDYLDWYTNDLSREIYNKVAEFFNCEDIAMTFMVSAYTDGQPPLLADCWAMQTMIKLETDAKISGTKDHKKIRDECVNAFAALLGLKNDGPNRLQRRTILKSHDRTFQCGAGVDEQSTLPDASSTTIERKQLLMQKMERWRHEKPKTVQKELSHMVAKAGSNAYRKGLISMKSK
eukprot:CAMPEP_0119556306 /NCGR_PEP_ID=MMETSP1352-20130426/8306_1 /TAXON_ID=265584 /ORGANISM="Stauroneis constricta, Strain CCMP1120" /LENGTH=432 /DNA_ID=CAMNT_0007603249 /DNA_START=158 /DNA_END=1456 /DNA_ORIENTATION=+